MRPTQACLLALALAACASAAHWEKPGASEAQLGEDMQHCRVQARIDPEPRFATSNTGQSATPAPEPQEQRDAREAAAFQKCMRDKGYSAKR